MYRRSYDYTVTPEQREEFMKKVKTAINILGTYTVLNDYPYDMRRGKKVKTHHLTLFFYKYSKDVIDLIDGYNTMGYTVLINSSDNQSIPEIQHLHFIKIIE